MVRRAGIAQALLGDPEVLLFDEPTAGLDPEERMRFQNVVAARRRKGVILISTHIVGDVEALCGTILILHQGKLAAAGTAQEIAQVAQGKVYAVPGERESELRGSFFVKSRGEENGLRSCGCSPKSHSPGSRWPPPWRTDTYALSRDCKELALFRLTLRKLGPLYFVPHLFLYGLIPLLGAGYLAYHGDGENARGLIFYDFQKFLPFFGCWWVLFGLSGYVEGPASELLQVYRPSLLGQFWLLWVWYLLHMAALFLGFSLFLENYWPDFPLVAIQSLAFAGAGFFLLCAAEPPCTLSHSAVLRDLRHALWGAVSPLLQPVLPQPGGAPRPAGPPLRPGGSSGGAPGVPGRLGLPPPRISLAGGVLPRTKPNRTLLRPFEGRSGCGPVLLFQRGRLLFSPSISWTNSL